MKICYIIASLEDMIDINEYNKPWMPMRLAGNVMAEIDQKTIDNWLRRGHIDSIDSRIGQGKERKYSLKNCIQLTAMRFLTQSGMQARAAGIISLEVAYIGEKLISGEINYPTELDWENLFLVWSGNPLINTGPSKLEFVLTTQKHYINHLFNGPFKYPIKSDVSVGLRFPNSIIDAGYLTRRNLDNYLEILSHEND